MELLLGIKISIKVADFNREQTKQANAGAKRYKKEHE